MTILISVVEREIEVRTFPNINDAQQTMLAEYLTAISGYIDEIPDTSEFDFNNIDTMNEICSDDCQIGTASAWVNDGPNHDNYDWKIVEL